MQTRENRSPKNNWPLYTAWVGLSALSIPIAWGTTMVILSIITALIGGTIQVDGQTHITEDYLGAYVLFPLIGLVTGFFQYLILRQRLGGMGWWVPTTVLGWILPITLLRWIFFFVEIPFLEGSIFIYALFIACIGSLLGMLQWLVLRKRAARTGWWILASAVGWGAVSLVTGKTLSTTADSVAVAFVPALVTGFALWIILEGFPRKV